MTRNDLNEILETCLEQLEAGETVEQIVAHYPDQADDLRALLLTAQVVMPRNGSLRVPAPAQVDSRKRFLAKAQQYQQKPRGVLPWAVLRFFRSNLGSIAFAAAAFLLLFIALGSLKALPGDSLYPFKLAAEQASISLAGNPASRQDQETVIDQRRATDVRLMIQMKRTGAVSFGGYLVNVHPKEPTWQVAGISLVLSPTQQEPARALSQAYVEVRGTLGPDGQVQVSILEPRLEVISGAITSLEPGGWRVGEQFVRINASTSVQGTPRVGRQAKIQAAALLNSRDMLGIRAEVLSESPLTASETSTQTSEPTSTTSLTETPTQTETPALTSSPEATEQPTQTENTARSPEQSTPTPGGSSGESGGSHNSTPASGDHHEGGD